MKEYKCRKCKKELDADDAYEYRGAISCAEHHNEVSESREFERQEVIAEESARTERFRGLDMSPNTAVGKANIELLKPTCKESGRLKQYERGQ